MYFVSHQKKYRQNVAFSDNERRDLSNCFIKLFSSLMASVGFSVPTYSVSPGFSVIIALLQVLFNIGLMCVSVNSVAWKRWLSEHQVGRHQSTPTVLLVPVRYGNTWHPCYMAPIIHCTIELTKLKH